LTGQQQRIIPAVSILAIAMILVISPFYQIFAGAENDARIPIDFNGPVGNTGLPGQWSLRVTYGKPDATVLQQKDENILLLRCANASFSLERAVSVSPREYPFVTWSWKAMKLPSAGDVRKKTRNDQGLQILLAFENRKIISYVWDANAPAGTINDESLGWPFNVAIKVIVVQSGTDRINEWVTHTRDVYQDYRNLFNEDASSERAENSGKYAVHAGSVRRDD
jgi:hypothetical protein